MTDNDSLDEYGRTDCVEINNYNQLQDLFYDEQSKNLKFVHINIHSCYKNFDSLVTTLEGISIHFHFIILTEAWLIPEGPIFNLDRYNTYYTTDTWNRSDGVVVYVKSEFNALSKQIRMGDAQGLRLDFVLNGQKCDLLAVYRSPPMDFQRFIDRR